jgi:hypothetical protein
MERSTTRSIMSQAGATDITSTPVPRKRQKTRM